MTLESSAQVLDDNYSITPLGSTLKHSNVLDSVRLSSGEQQIDNTDYESLKCQSLRMERLLQVMPAGVIVIDGKGIVRQANTLAKELLGEPLEEQLWRNIIARSFRPRADDGHEVSLHDGRRVKLSIAPLIDEPGQLIVLTDLTETRQLQARISHMQRLSSLGKMVASLAHQIRTPLSAALLYASNLAHRGIDESKQEKFISRLTSRLKELESQVNDMLLFAKSGNEQVLTPLQVVQLVSDTQQCCEAMLQQANVVLDTQVSSQAQEKTLLANSNALNGALVNLIHNAVQVSPKGSTIQFKADIEGSNKLIIKICDQGTGIQAANLQKIFEPFFTTKTNGTGLGLAVVKAAITAHNGTVHAENSDQQGAEFHITLPLHKQINENGFAPVTVSSGVNV
jgi:two-component system sensor histidine kinase FlrB